MRFRNFFYLMGIVSLGVGLLSCSQSRVKRYESLIGPKLGVASKTEMNKLLGHPARCRRVKLYEQCEYRTAKERNDPVPDVHKPGLAGSPDLRPYAYFDVIHLYYDETDVLREWTPVNVSD